MRGRGTTRTSRDGLAVTPREKRRFALAGTGLFLLVSLAFLVPALGLLLQWRHESDPAKQRENLIALAVCAGAGILALVGAIQWARVATGRVKIRWEWDDDQPTRADEENPTDRGPGPDGGR